MMQIANCKMMQKIQICANNQRVAVSLEKKDE
jgi:hypothetical protein